MSSSEQDSGKWRWSTRHPWQSWRERYKNNQEWFDWKILAYQRKHGIKAESSTYKANFTNQPRPQSNRNSTLEETEETESSSDEPSRGDGRGKRKWVEENEEEKSKKARKQNEASQISSGEESKRKPRSKLTLRNPTPEPMVAKVEDDEKNDEKNDDKEKVDEERRGAAVSKNRSMKDMEAGQPVNGIEELSRCVSILILIFSELTEQLYRQASTANATSESSKQAVFSPGKSIMPLHSTPHGEERLYPDLTNDLSAIPKSGSQYSPAEPHLPGAFDATMKREFTAHDRAPQQLLSAQDSHPSQEPTPPLSNMDTRSPRPGTAQDMGRRSSSRHVFPGGDYKIDLPIRTNTPVLESSSERYGNVSVPKKSKHVLKRRRSSQESDFFESVPPTPTTDASHERTLREPPKFVENPFGSAFTDGRLRAPVTSRESRIESDSDGDVSDDDQDIKAEVGNWPPSRNRVDADVKGKGKAIDKRLANMFPPSPPPQTSVKSLNLDEMEAPSRVITMKSTDQHHAFSQPTQVYAAVLAPEFSQTANKPETISPASFQSHHPFTQPSQILGTITSTTSLEARRDLHKLIDGLPGSRESTVNRQTESKPSFALPRQSVAGRSDVPPAPVVPQESTSSTTFLDLGRNYPVEKKLFKFPLPQGPSRGSSSDPFLVPAVTRIRQEWNGNKGKEKTTATFDNGMRRKTFGGFGQPTAVPKVDLTMKTKHAHRRIFPPAPRHSMPMPGHGDARAETSSRRISTPANHANASPSSSPSNLSSADQSAVMRIGIGSVIQGMSKNHGFTEEVVRRVWRHVNNLERTDAVLRTMRESAEAAVNESLDDEQFNGRDDDLANVQDGGGSPPTSPSQLKEPNSSLHITPATVNADYSPPETSRASRYARLSRQGRRHEALALEKKKVSLGDYRDFERSIRKSWLSRRSSHATPIASDVLDEKSNSTPYANSSPLSSPVPVAISAPTNDVWGEKEDEILAMGTDEGLKMLEDMVGPAELRRRTIEFFV